MSIYSLGSHYCVASPHNRAAFQGLSGMVHARMSLEESALLMNLSLFNSLPHLCGLGGDAIIMHKKNQKITLINGTGKTGRYQHTESYREKGMTSIPRRGVYSTMVYGAPYAYGRFQQEANIDLGSVTDFLLNYDATFGVNPCPELKAVFEKSFQERGRFTHLAEWDSVLRHYGKLHHSLVTTLQHIAKYGFCDMYNGTLGDATFNQINAFDNKLYSENDFTDFMPNDEALMETEFCGSKIHCHGNNSPWLELFLLLKVYELAEMDQDYSLTAYDIARLIPSIEEDAIDASLWSHAADLDVMTMAKKIVNRYKHQILPEKDTLHKQSHTVFLAGVNSDGDLVGITNSIYTPLGAIFEVNETGVLLSNRCYAFNQYRSYYDFVSNSPVKHTNNIVIVENDNYSFIIGTSGGPVQSQTLAFLIKKIVMEGYTPEQAIKLPRFANLGRHPKTDKMTYLAEPGTHDPAFTLTDDMSNKFGVVQMAGVDKRMGCLFSCADPRGAGVALGV